MDFTSPEFLRGVQEARASNMIAGAGWVEGFLLSDAIIYLQVYAFAQSRWVGRYLILQFVAGVVVGVTLQTLVIQETKWITSGIRGLHCVPVNLATGFMGALFASSIPLWVSLVIITIWTMMRKYRYCQSVILNALFRDGLVYMYGMAGDLLHIRDDHYV
ncbi:hypothetical protein CC1G_12148 [Coprinopsis cinerea okayama7|uniref:Uncharacterized protein n=1 Tax=Coprinopsis cinerea (strain Okayama-7 / 130 / ATCC MYA-4618 / FGSC 9003) TaxID=240176 RepID=A8P6Z4_COPC7|nr:hypothetical protein CC1G_12148 [Coprinopsis cinerea okayama7\|eukprot:XP_001839257.2 hypothetical protein CC1G_12148 [Coprinopsis cinerea okayama7\